MAKDKKSFILYNDQIEIFEELSDTDAGQLIKHLFRYTNDLNPETMNPMVKISFISIKQALKRDLRKFEGIKLKRSDAGKKSAELRALKKSTLVDSVENIPTNPTVSDSDSDSDSDSVSDNVINKKTKVFNFRKSLLNLGLEKILVEDFLKNRKLKKLANTETAFKNMNLEFKKSGIQINKLFEMIVSKGWGSFKCSWLNIEIKEIGLKPKDLSEGKELLNVKNPNKK